MKDGDHYTTSVRYIHPLSGHIQVNLLFQEMEKKPNLTKEYYDQLKKDLEPVKALAEVLSEHTDA